MADPRLKGHPAVFNVYVPVRAFNCPRCVADPDTEYDRHWHHRNPQQNVPLADDTIVCWKHATDDERRNRWCETCHAVKDRDEFDPVPGYRGEPKPHTWRRSCRACLAPTYLTRPCDHCAESFTPKRSDARFCSGRCRVAAHRSR